MAQEKILGIQLDLVDVTTELNPLLTSSLNTDTTPQLGGALDVNNFAITSTTGDVNVDAGNLNIHNTIGIIGQGSLRVWNDTNTGHTTGSYVELAAPVLGASIVLTLPSSTGSVGQLLATDGTGVLSWAAGPSTSSLVTYTTDHVLILANGDDNIMMDVAIANSITVPLDAVVAFPNNTSIQFMQLGIGQTTIVAEVGVTIRSPSQFFATTEQYSMGYLLKIGPDEWILSGDLI